MIPLITYSISVAKHLIRTYNFHFFVSLQDSPNRDRKVDLIGVIIKVNRDRYNIDAPGCKKRLTWVLTLEYWMVVKYSERLGESILNSSKMRDWKQKICSIFLIVERPKEFSYFLEILLLSWHGKVLNVI